MNSHPLLPDVLCHYYEAAHGPFRNLSSLPPEDAEIVLDNLRRNDKVFASKRAMDYLRIRRELEQRIRSMFIARGGRPVNAYPHYMVLGHVPWLEKWYEHGRALCLPLSNFDESAVSFTYGDTFPAMRFQDGKPYRGQVYVLGELPALIEEYGLPQEGNPEGLLGPDRYIEAQVWTDAALLPYLPAVK